MTLTAKQKLNRKPGTSAQRSVAELLENFRLRPETRKLLPELVQKTAANAFADLFDKRIYADAIRLLAVSLPKPAAIWWGTLCAWDLYSQPSPELTPKPELAHDALAAALDWVRYPSEATRRAAERAGKEAKPSSVAGALALAAAWSEGSLAPVGLPAVPPAWYLTGKLTAGALLLTAANKRPYDLHLHYRRYLQMGIEVAAGRLMWPALTATELAIVESHDHEALLKKGRVSLPAGQLLDQASSSQEFLVDQPANTPPAPHLKTSLMTAREQLAGQLAQLDTLINSEQFS